MPRYKDTETLDVGDVIYFGPSGFRHAGKSALVLERYKTFANWNLVLLVDGEKTVLTTKSRWILDSKTRIEKAK